MAEVNPTPFLEQYDGGLACYTATQFRQVFDGLICSGGVVNRLAGALAVTAGGGMSVNVAAGTAFIEGTVVAGSGMYFVRSDSTKNLAVAPADPTDPRIDYVIARIYDTQWSGVSDDWQIEIVPGVASPVPVAPAVPASSIVLASYFVPAGDTVIDANQIVDQRRSFQYCSENGGTPPGVIEMWAGNAAPTGYQLLDGSAIARGANQTLFGLWGTTYGAGDGSTTFNVPNLKGRFPVMRDAAQPEFDTIGEVGGADTHTHPLSDAGQAAIAVTTAGTNNLRIRQVNSANYTNTHDVDLTPAPAVAGSSSTVGAALLGATDAGSSLPPYMVLNFIVKLG